MARPRGGRQQGRQPTSTPERPSAPSTPERPSVPPVEGIKTTQETASTDDLLTIRARIDDVRRELNARLDTLTAAIDRLLPAPPPIASPPRERSIRKTRTDLRPGDDVYVPRLNGTYTVVESLAGADTFKVQAGPMRVELRYDEVWPLEDAPPAEQSSARFVPSPNRPNPNPAIPSIDLHGYSEANALITLELFLHHEYARGTPRVRVIHGKGNGVLRDAVRRELTRSQLVRTVDVGPHFQGDEGVTLADLDL
jgi:DNA mismatch repair protein MutS2